MSAFRVELADGNGPPRRHLAWAGNLPNGGVNCLVLSALSVYIHPPFGARWRGMLPPHQCQNVPPTPCPSVQDILVNKYLGKHSGNSGYKIEIMCKQLKQLEHLEKSQKDSACVRIMNGKGRTEQAEQCQRMKGNFCWIFLIPKHIFWHVPTHSKISKVLD